MNTLESTSQKTWTVYRHTSPSNKVYIGITSYSVNRRWGNNGEGYKNCIAFEKAIKKYGWDNIKHEILFEGLSEKRAKDLEIALIRHYKGLKLSYNITDGGDGALGRRNSDATIEKMRKAKLGKPLSPEHKAKIQALAAKRRGIPRSIEVIEKLKIANKGKKPSQKTIEAAKEYRRLHPVPQYVIDKMHEAAKAQGYASQIEALNRNRESIALKHKKSVVQFSLQGKYLCTYDSGVKASSTTKVDASTIAACCRGKALKAGEFLWMYESEYLQCKENGKLEEMVALLVERVNNAPKQGKYTRTEEWRKQKSESQKGVDKRSAETKAYMSQRSVETTSKPVLQLTIEGIPIAVYPSITSAAEAVKDEKSSGFICRCCQRKIKTAYGYKWDYIPKSEYNNYSNLLSNN